MENKIAEALRKRVKSWQSEQQHKKQEEEKKKKKDEDIKQLTKNLQKALQQQVKSKEKEIKVSNLRDRLSQALISKINIRKATLEEAQRERDQVGEIIRRKIQEGLAQLMKDEKSKVKRKKMGLELQEKFKEALLKKIMEDEKF